MSRDTPSEDDHRRGEMDAETQLQNEAVFGDGDPAHLDDADVEARIAAGAAFTTTELEHLARCVECRTVVALVTADQQPPESLAASPLGRGLWLAAAAVLAIGAGLAAWPALRGDDGYTRKGAGAPLTAEMTLLATGPDGARRDVRDGDVVRLDDRLGFKYGNPDGRHRTLTVVGWDGQQLRWYYPASADGAPHAAEPGLARRLPFDVKLDDHRPGTLVVVAAFDADPAKLAADLRAGRAPPGALRLTVEAAR